MITIGLILFTLLWVISCWTIYKLLLKKLEQAEQLYEEGRRFNQRAADLYSDAKAANQQALDNRLAAIRQLEQIRNSLNCLN